MQKMIPSLQVFRTALLILLGFVLFSVPAQAADRDVLLQGEMARFKFREPPKELPDVSFQDAGGQKVKLSSFRGKLVLLTVWATWCPYCQKELPELSDVQAALGQEKFMVLPISIDKEGVRVVKKYLEEKSINLPTYVDPKTNVSIALETHGIPYSVLIDAQGREIGRVHGQTAWRSPEAIALLKAFMP